MKSVGATSVPLIRQAVQGQASAPNNSQSFQALTPLEVSGDTLCTPSVSPDTTPLQVPPSPQPFPPPCAPLALPFQQNHTPAIKLDTNANNFERNMTDRFQPKAIDVGPLTHIFISKTGGGLGGDWHLQEVEIFHPGVGPGCEPWAVND